MLPEIKNATDIWEIKTVMQTEVMFETSVSVSRFFGQRNCHK